MNFSGLLVTAAEPVRADPAAWADLAARLAALPGVEVHHADAASGRLVVVQEADAVAAEVEGFTRIRTLAGVVDVALVSHCFDEQNPSLSVRNPS